MPAVLCVIGPARSASDRASELARAAIEALDAWLSREP
jgi:hypothetical protein